MNATLSDSAPPSGGRKFGAFGGVFTPSILTILGVIFFLRAGAIIGHAGILGALYILLTAEGIVVLTALSMAAVATNSRVRGGGAYFLISRALGPSFGGAIGLTLFFAQALSVPFYILGFSEALTASAPALQDHFLAVNVITACVLFAINAFGAGWAMRLQYIVMILLALSILSIFAGAAVHFDPAIFRSNLAPAPPSSDNGFWILFAIYFPAVTGIMTGINMSGDLKEPSRALVTGTFWAIGVGFAVYFLQILLLGGSLSRVEMVETPYGALLQHALLGTGFLIAAGVYSASISSAIGSFLAAPRVLQAVGRDDVFPLLRPYAKGRGRSDEPIRGLVLTGALTLIVLLFATRAGSGGGFNLVARVVTTFFLITYGMVNLAAFVEAFSANPSFRPRFRWFHWGTGLAGAAACFCTMLLIDAPAAAMASLVLGGLYVLIARRVVRTAYGDARRGFLYGSVSRNLLRLRSLSPHPKNWRPTVLVLSGNPNSRLNLVQLAEWMGAGSGIVTLAQMLTGRLSDLDVKRTEEQQRLEAFIRENDLNVFPQVVVAADFDEGVRVLLQSHSIGPIKPNLVMMGWPRESSRVAPFVLHLEDIRRLGLSAIVVIDRALPAPGRAERIDIWWRGMANGSLMVILAYLLQQNWEWKRTRVRVLRAVDSDAGLEPARKALHRLIEVARIPAEAAVIPFENTFKHVLQKHSGDAALVFLGFEPVSVNTASDFHRRYDDLLEEMPTTVLVNSTGEADLLA